MDELLNRLDGARVHDVHVSGFLDRDFGTPRFSPLPGTAYLDLGDRFVRIDGSESPGSLTLSLVTEMTVPAALVDEDEEFMTASLGTLLFSCTPLPLTRIRYAVTDATRAAAGVVRCAEFRLGPSICLFFDPWTFEQLRLAASDGYDDWHHRDRPRDLEIHGSVSEHLWEPQTTAH